mgnify:FL=1
MHNFLLYKATGDCTTEGATSTSTLSGAADTSVCCNDSPTREIELDGPSTRVRHSPRDHEDTPAPMVTRPRKKRPDTITTPDVRKPAARRSLGLGTTSDTKRQSEASAANTKSTSFVYAVPKLFSLGWYLFF